MLWKCCTQYASKYGKLISGHRTGKGQFSFQSQRKAMPKNAQVQFSSVARSLIRVWLFVTPWITARQASLSITNSRSSLRLTSIESVMPSSHLIFCRPLLLLPPIPPSIRVFSNESNYCTIALISHARKVMLKILQARLQQYLNHEIPDVQAGFRKGRGTRNQIGNICWIMEKAREFQKNIYFCFIDYAKAFNCVDHHKLENSERDGNTRPPDLPPEKSVCRSKSNS